MGKLEIKPTERVFLAGKTGSGKTFLAERLTATLPRLVVLDGKGTLNGRFGAEEWSRAGEKKLVSGKPVRLRFLDPITEDPKAAYDQLFYLLYQAGDLVAYIDEANSLRMGTNASPYLNALYTRGRELNIGVWASTQRPVNVPRIMLSEAEWFFIFRLSLQDDRDTVAGNIGPQVRETIRDRHGFWFYNIEWTNPRYTRGIRA